MTVPFLKSLYWPDREDAMTCHQVRVLHTKLSTFKCISFHFIVRLFRM